MARTLDTDYLIVGAGAAGMAFADQLLTHTDATITMVDRRGAPGGHWIDAYPFVRLHQPSAFYGVDSVPLGTDNIDTVGSNAGFYELAGPDEIRAYYECVMHRHFLPTGRLSYFPNCDYRGNGIFVSRLSGQETSVRMRKLIDTTYLEGAIPATSPPPFDVAEDVTCIPLGDLPNLDEAPESLVIVGAGKTAMDACVWLLERGVEPARITWIKPREAWWLNRKFQQPGELFPDLYRGIGLVVSAMAEATSLRELFDRLEEHDYFLRVDRTVDANMFWGAVVSEGEIELLRRIENVVRMGHVQAITDREIVLDEGSIQTTANTVHVHCAARALSHPPLRPIFEGDRVTFQPFVWGFACYQAALAGLIEATIDSDEEKNKLCTPLNYWEKNSDFPKYFLATMVGDRIRSMHPHIKEWPRKSRLSPSSWLAPHKDHPKVTEGYEAIKKHGTKAAGNLANLLTDA